MEKLLQSVLSKQHQLLRINRRFLSYIHAHVGPNVSKLPTLQLKQILPYVNFLVATSALAFQTTVLYPWHKRLDQDFDILRDEQDSKLKEYHVVKLEALSHIEQELLELMNEQSKIRSEIKDVVSHEHLGH